MLPWAKELVLKLKSIDLVSDIHCYDDCIIVKYKTGFKRSYVFKKAKNRLYATPINPDNVALNWPIEVSYEHQWDPLIPSHKEELLKYFNISRATINKCSMMDIELLIQHIMTLCTNGYIKPYLTDSDIDAELTRLADLNHVICRNGVTTYKFRGMKYSKRKPMQAIFEKYYDMPKLWHWWRSYNLGRAFTIPKIMYSVLRHIIHKTKWDINITTIHRALYRRKYGPRWYNPTIFAILLESIPMEGRTLVDGSPNHNEKIITAWMLKCKYASIDGSTPPQALIDRLGVEIVPADKPYDMLVLDNGFKEIDIDIIIASRKLCNSMLVYVDTSQAAIIAKQLKPDQTIRVNATPRRSGQRRSNYIFIYDSKNKYNGES